jgi:hypothetical protein
MFSSRGRNTCAKCNVEDDGSKIKCRNCQKVFHLDCVSLSLYNFSPSEWTTHQWHCEVCSRNNLGFVSAALTGQPPFINVLGVCMRQVVDMLRSILESFKQQSPVEDIKRVIMDQKVAYEANTEAMIRLQTTQLKMMREITKLTDSVNRLCESLEKPFNEISVLRGQNLLHIADFVMRVKDQGVSSSAEDIQGQDESEEIQDSESLNNS